MLLSRLWHAKFSSSLSFVISFLCFAKFCSCKTVVAHRFASLFLQDISYYPHLVCYQNVFLRLHWTGLILGDAVLACHFFGSIHCSVSRTGMHMFVWFDG